MRGTLAKGQLKPQGFSDKRTIAKTKLLYHSVKLRRRWYNGKDVRDIRTKQMAGSFRWAFFHPSDQTHSLDSWSHQNDQTGQHDRLRSISRSLSVLDHISILYYAEYQTNRSTPSRLEQWPCEIVISDVHVNRQWRFPCGDYISRNSRPLGLKPCL
ncbi:hypothetical protein P152DRAFT_326822 [Eremomyces bilateralis CBS 781.70]|uniref:Uncharacterized protein n=1 Tax=Eremomyces bilateralis CBS 781.70 TaxID=1392243 RepID=A0A6G1G497_9PEZI|nr:uncharacterized protein P152DRAFT_326822 [Eremomyces bilateralis CBS 781.70]KAF1812812.1 hypothetical protein P152DRAFT_326822 [Eremomyces bilateralis CBS 781.70]